MKRLHFRRLGIAAVIVAMLVATVLPAGFARAADTSSDDYLHTDGSQILDEEGNAVRLTGIAWFGFETSDQCFDGLWAVNLESTLQKVADEGFNILRVPVCVQLVDQWRSGGSPMPMSINQNVNPALVGMTSLQILDRAVADCKKDGIKIMLDMHRVVNTQQLDGWTGGTYTAADYEACWVWLANHFKSDDTVIACDLFNEPHGQAGDANAIKWDGSSDANNWRYEAEQVSNAILNVNPNLLMVVEGIEATPKAGHDYTDTSKSDYDYDWWGGNLRGVAQYPVNLGAHQDELVYSPHDYGPSVSSQPWFESSFTEESLTEQCWEPNWLYINDQNIAPILVGEWGGRMDGGANQQWMGYLADTIAKDNLNETFWCLNPNSGDTGGILLDDWTTVDTAKYNLIEPTLWQIGGQFVGLDHQVNLGKNGTHVGAGPGGGSSSSSGSSAPTLGDLTVQAYNTSLSPTTNGIAVHIRVTNTSDDALDLSQITLRYYFTDEGGQPANFYCDYSTAGTANVSGSFHTLPQPVAGADSYIEISFSSAAGSLDSGMSAEIQGRISKTDWSNFDQTNDYSFDPTDTAYADAPQIPAYASGTLIWGTEPQ